MIRVVINVWFIPFVLHRNSDGNYEMDCSCICAELLTVRGGERERRGREGERERGGGERGRQRGRQRERERGREEIRRGKIKERQG